MADQTEQTPQPGNRPPPAPLRIDAARLLGDLDRLRQVGRVGTGVHRPAFSAADVAAREWLAGRFAEAGLVPQIDRIGNVFGRSPDTRRALLVGSHTDTVPMGGWLDGALGVIAALEVVRALKESGHVGDIGVDVVSFADEEGTFRGTAGSLAFTGALTEAEMAAIRGPGGVTLAEAAAPYAGNPALPFDPERCLGFLEIHIEQGARLEQAGVPIGVVTGIVGIRHAEVAFEGQADHAGTTPMAVRRDAGRAAFLFATALDARFRSLAGPDTVWNFGIIHFAPGAANVVPKRATLTVEWRDTDPARLDRMAEAVEAASAEAASAARVTAGATPGSRLEPTPLDPWLAGLIDQAARAAGHATMHLPSGAGHDAMVLARHVPAAMLFVPSIGGRSHDVAEDTAPADIVRGVEVLAAAVAAAIAALEDSPTRR